MKTINLFIFFLLGVCLAACNDNENQILTESEVLVKGNGDSVVMSMNGTDWNIEGVYTLDGNTMVDEDNKPLALEGLGSIVFQWYRIVRDDYGTLKIIVFENFGDSERGFILKLYREGYTQDFRLKQKATAGYKFDEIVFH